MFTYYLGPWAQSAAGCWHVTDSVMKGHGLLSSDRLLYLSIPTFLRNYGRPSDAKWREVGEGGPMVGGGWPVEGLGVDPWWGVTHRWGV